MEYRIVSHHSIQEVVKQVADLLALGWVCQGGVSISHHPSGGGSIMCAQAMVREVK